MHLRWHAAVSAAGTLEFGQRVECPALAIGAPLPALPVAPSPLSILSTKMAPVALRSKGPPEPAAPVADVAGLGDAFVALTRESTRRVSTSNGGGASHGVHQSATLLPSSHQKHPNPSAESIPVSPRQAGLRSPAKTGSAVLSVRSPPLAGHRAILGGLCQWSTRQLADPDDSVTPPSTIFTPDLTIETTFFLFTPTKRLFTTARARAGACLRLTSPQFRNASCGSAFGTDHSAAIADLRQVDRS